MISERESIPRSRLTHRPSMLWGPRCRRTSFRKAPTWSAFAITCGCWPHAPGCESGRSDRPIRPGPGDAPGGLPEARAVPGAGDAERGAWLRAILARNVADVLRAQGRLKRDVSRERSLEQELDSSSVRLGALLAAEGPTPSEHAQRHEQAIRLADVLARLPVDQREAVILHYWQGCTLAEVGDRLDRTTSAVAGLLKRGLKNLREQLEAPSGPRRRS